MSMILGLATLSDANIARVLADPPLIWKVIAPDDPEIYEEARASLGRPSLLSKLLGRGRSSVNTPDLVLTPGEGDAVDLDKAWHGIHYLLTGSAWEGEFPQNFLVVGGKQVGDIDVGYGPARVLTAAETRAARDALRAIGDDELKARFLPDRMLAEKIYPEIWDRDPAEDDMFSYLLENVKTLRTFLDRAVAGGSGIVVSLT